jgi:hypothetical protein
LQISSIFVLQRLSFQFVLAILDEFQILYCAVFVEQRIRRPEFRGAWETLRKHFLLKGGVAS